MRKHNIWLPFTDIFYIFLFRMKLILKDKTTAMVLVISVILFAILIRSLSTSAEDQSSLPVGIVDYDNSKCSKDLVSALKEVTTLRMIEENAPKLQELLLDEMITSIFIIEKGYEERLKSGDLKDMITMYYKKENKSASIISEIVAGEMIYPVSYYKGYRYYEQTPFEGSKQTASQYESYMRNFVGNRGDFDFAFDMIYTNQEKIVVAEQQISNSVLYNQFIIGILGIFIAFLAMFLLSGTVREKEMGVVIRQRISRFNILKSDLGNLGALLITEGLIALPFTSLVMFELKSKDIRLWASAYILILLNALVLGGAMLLIAKMINRMLLYQVFCSVLILLTGGLGFYHLLTGFYQGFADNLIKIIPNSWFIKGFTDIIIYGSEGGYFKDGHLVLLSMAVILFVLIICIDIIQSYCIKLASHRRR